MGHGQADREKRILELLRSLGQAQEQSRQAILAGDAASLERLADEERRLAQELRGVLEEEGAGRPAGGRAREGWGEPVRAQARRCQRLYVQNQLLLQHASQTVRALLQLLSGSGVEPAGLYGPSGRSLPTSVDRQA